MRLRWCAPLAVAMLLVGVAGARAADGATVGEAAPALEGKWVSADGKAPDLKGKVVLIDFYHEQ